jgi:hypothetical protein
VAAGDTYPGRRVESLDQCTEPGDYLLRDSVDPDGTPRGYRELWFVLPDGSDGRSKRHITDDKDRWTFTDADGAVTASPSIWAHVAGLDGKLVPGWHGYLEAGVWREV